MDRTHLSSPRRRIALVAVAALAVAACGSDREGQAPVAADPAAVAETPASTAAPAATASTPPPPTPSGGGVVVEGDNSGAVVTGDGVVVSGGDGGVVVSDGSVTIDGQVVEPLVGSGVVVTEARAATGFTAIDVRAFGVVVVDVNGTEAVEVEADDNLLPRVVTVVEGGRLVIDVEPGSYRDVTLRVRVGAARLDGATVSGSGDLVVSGLAAPAFGLTVAGSGDGLLSGAVEDLTVVVDGSGEVDAAGLVAQRASVSVAGSGDVLVDARQSLDARIDGSGDVQYLGSPAVTATVQGSGEVEPA